MNPRSAMLTPCRLFATAALVLSACGGELDTAETQDNLTIDASNVSALFNPCLNVTADRSLSFGAGSASKWDVSTNSGSGFATYMSADRDCKKFVVDVTLPADNTHATIGNDRFSSDVFSDVAAPYCSGVEVKVAVYSKIDAGGWTYQGSKTLHGQWHSFGGYCSAESADGEEYISVPAVETQTKRVFRVLSTATAFNGFPIPVETAGHITAN